MAKLKIFSMFDVKTTTFHSPFVSHHTGEALRGWEEGVNKADTLPNKFPSDFQLWELGVFDSGSGEFEDCKPRMLATALEYKRHETQQELPISREARTSI